MSEIAQLMLPAVRWDRDHGFSNSRADIDRAISAGVGGFIFFGGPAEEVRTLIGQIVARSDVPLLIGADLERGAGQQFPGATGLPPLAAIGSLGNADDVLRAARLTASEAQWLGVNWVYGPVCDLDVEPDNPIVGTRSFGRDPLKSAELAVTWIDSCQSEGVLACAKHFPGHGRTTRDSHAELPTVDASADVLETSDLVPFRAAIEAGVASIMSAHVAFPALDASGAPATLSRRILTDILRRQMGYKGLVVTDALIMEGVLGEGGENGAVVGALSAGCDLLLYPADHASAERAVTAAISDGRLDVRQVSASLERRHAWADWAKKSVGNKSLDLDKAWARGVAERVVHAVSAPVPALERAVDFLVIDDDIGGPYPPPSREPFAAELRSAGYKLRDISGGEAPTSTQLLLALYGDIRAWKGRPGYSEKSRASVADAISKAKAAGQSVLIVQFSHPRLAAEISATEPILCAWGGEDVMQRAAGRVLALGKILNPGVS